MFGGNKNLSQGVLLILILTQNKLREMLQPDLT